MTHILAALLLVLISSHIAISISTVEATEYPYTYTSPPSYYKYESPPPPRYKYESPRPPPPPYKSPPPPFKAVVTGTVYCDICKNGKLNKPLKGVTVGVFCWNGKSEDSFYGTTNDTGTFNIKLKGFDFVGCGGAKACAAELISANYSTPCTQPTNKHGGQKGARLHVKAKSKNGVTLKAGPFAYTPISKHPKCYDHSKAACPPPPPPPTCPPPARPGPCPPPPNPPPCRPPPPPNCPPPPPPPQCPPNPCPPPPPPPACPSPPPSKYDAPAPPSF